MSSDIFLLSQPFFDNKGNIFLCVNFFNLLRCHLQNQWSSERMLKVNWKASPKCLIPGWYICVAIKVCRLLRNSVADLSRRRPPGLVRELWRSIQRSSWPLPSNEAHRLLFHQHTFILLYIERMSGTLELQINILATLWGPAFYMHIKQCL